MTNREWLYSLHPSALAAWFDAEHVETPNATLDGDTAALNAKINELRAYEREWRELCKQIMEERELYRLKLGKALDYADAIHALMDDEGMA